MAPAFKGTDTDWAVMILKRSRTVHRGYKTACREYTGTSTSGYGVASRHTKHHYTHRVAVAVLDRKPVPPGMETDHLCRNKLCFRRSHLEVVTQTVNTLRGVGLTAVNAARTECIRGHEFTPENTYYQRAGYRGCRQCRWMRKRGLI